MMKLADRITAYLFTNGANNQARRLVFEMEDGSNGGGWAREPARDAIQNLLDAEPKPEGCKLVAHDTGDGWYLGVEDGEGSEVAMLEWPSGWPETMPATKLREFGFEIV
jgi:hypothetical protein